jgi:hypothetical protein
MKIYIEYEVPNSPAPIFFGIGEKIMDLKAELLKHKVMWAVRHLEKVIEEEGGVIVLRNGQRPQPKGFTPDTEIQILEAISSITI